MRRDELFIWNYSESETELKLCVGNLIARCSHANNNAKRGFCLNKVALGRLATCLARSLFNENHTFAVDATKSVVES